MSVTFGRLAGEAAGVCQVRHLTAPSIGVFKVAKNVLDHFYATIYNSYFDCKLVSFLLSKKLRHFKSLMVICITPIGMGLGHNFSAQGRFGPAHTGPL